MESLLFDLQPPVPQTVKKSTGPRGDQILTLEGHERKGFPNDYFSSVTTVGPSTSLWRNSKAFKIYLRRNSFSFSGLREGFPTGLGTASPCRIRLTPNICAMLGMAVICTKGKPAFSMLDAIVAPQRVPDPQVEVRMTAPTPPFFFISAAISSPISPHLFETVVQPQVP